MSMDYIRRFYGLNQIKRGTKVIINTPRMGEHRGIVSGSEGARIRIKITDLPKQPIFTYHPEDECIKYLG